MSESAYEADSTLFKRLERAVCRGAGLALGEGGEVRPFEDGLREPDK